MLHRGFAFRTHHIFVVVSDPRKNDDKVVVVNVTSCKTRSDHARPDVILPGEHHAIKVPSYVAFARAKVLSEALLEMGLGGVERLQDFSPDLLARICRCAKNAVELDPKVKAVLSQQGL